jgi:DNA-binding NtrC family response regulator
MKHRIFEDELRRIQKCHIAHAMLAHNCKIMDAAPAVGYHRRTLGLWLKKLELRTLESIINASSLEPAPVNLDIERAYLEYERSELVRALDENGGNRVLTARALGIGRRTLIKKIKEYGLPHRSIGWQLRAQ